MITNKIKGYGVFSNPLNIYMIEPNRDIRGVTLETTIDSQGITMPQWDPSNSSCVSMWNNASTAYAQQASGDVYVILGNNVRPNSIWNTCEYPTLINNPNVTSIIAINPETLEESVLYVRP